MHREAFSFQSLMTRSGSGIVEGLSFSFPCMSGEDTIGSCHCNVLSLDLDGCVGKREATEVCGMEPPHPRVSRETGDPEIVL